MLILEASGIEVILAFHSVIYYPEFIDALIVICISRRDGQATAKVCRRTKLRP